MPPEIENITGGINISSLKIFMPRKSHNAFAFRRLCQHQVDMFIGLVMMMKPR